MFKKSILWGVATLFSIILTGFVLTFGLWQVFSTPVHIKQALNKSGLYDNAITYALEQVKNEEGDNAPDMTNKDIKKILTDCFPPQDLKKQTEGVLDGSYGWLQGKTETLDFKFDLSKSRTCLADGVFNYATTHLSSLPFCDASNMPSGEVDAFGATCLPPGTDVTAQAEQARQSILKSDFFKEGGVTADDLKNDQGQTLTEQFKIAKVAYQKAKTSLPITAAVSVLLGAGVVLLSANWRGGLRKVSVIFIVVGGVTAILGWLISAVMRKASAQLNQSEISAQLEHSSISMLQIIVDDIRKWWMSFGISLIVLGVATLIALRFTKPKAEISEKKA